MDLLKAGGFWVFFFNLQRVLPSPAAACGGLLMDLLIAALKYLWMLVRTERPSWETFKLLF